MDDIFGGGGIWDDGFVLGIGFSEDDVGFSDDDVGFSEDDKDFFEDDEDFNWIVFL